MAFTLILRLAALSSVLLLGACASKPTTEQAAVQQQADYSDSRDPLVYPGSYVEYVVKTGHEAPGLHS